VAIINGDLEWSERLIAHARRAGVHQIVTFGRSANCDVRLLSATLNEESSDLKIELSGKALTYRIGAPGEHWALNSLAVLATISSMGGDAVRAAHDMATLNALAGRGARERIRAHFGEFDLIDESYNANPLSMAAAIATLGRAQPGKGGRRIAVLGDMLELGPTADALHAGLAVPLREQGIDLVFASGPLMRHLWQDVAEHQRGGYADASSGIVQSVVNATRAGDVVMIKGSYGSKMRVVVEALQALGSVTRR
jgi:UDP-N-acetylmuramoyl-tripeptide--D-alanyl-D-alanine ligase